MPALRSCNVTNDGTYEGQGVAGGTDRLPAQSHRIRHLVTATDSVAAPRSKASPETLRAITRTVLLVHTKASSSMKRVDEASGASARSPCLAPRSRSDAPRQRPSWAGRGWSPPGTRAARPAASACRRAGPATPPANRRGAAPPARSARPGRRCRSARRQPRPRAHRHAAVQRGVGHGRAAGPGLRGRVPNHGGERGQHVAGDALLDGHGSVEAAHEQHVGASRPGSPRLSGEVASPITPAFDP